MPTSAGEKLYFFMIANMRFLFKNMKFILYLGNKLEIF